MALGAVPLAAGSVAYVMVSVRPPGLKSLLSVTYELSDDLELAQAFAQPSVLLMAWSLALQWPPGAASLKEADLRPTRVPKFHVCCSGISASWGLVSVRWKVRCWPQRAG